MIKGCKEKFFINIIFNENIRRLHQGKSFSAKNAFFAEKLFSLMKTSDIFVENLVNKKTSPCNLLSFDLPTWFQGF